MTLLVVTGLLAEARIAAAPGVATLAGGGDAGLDHRLERAIVHHRPRAILSFGVAGALDPALAVGDAVAGVRVVGEGWSAECDGGWAAALASACKARAEPVTALASPAATVEMKRALREATGAATADMESRAVALAARAADLPFAVLRVVSDAEGDPIPPAALVGMRADGGTDALAVVAALARSPRQLPALIRTARQYGLAMTRLRELRARAGPTFGFAG